MTQSIHKKSSAIILLQSLQLDVANTNNRNIGPMLQNYNKPQTCFLVAGKSDTFCQQNLCRYHPAAFFFLQSSLIEQVFTSNAASSGGNCAPTLSTGYASPANILLYQHKKSFANFPSDFLAIFFQLHSPSQVQSLYLWMNKVISIVRCVYVVVSKFCTKSLLNNNQRYLTSSKPYFMRLLKNIMLR